MPLKRFLGKFIPYKLKKNLRNYWILSYQYGQSKSIKHGRCLDQKNKEIPWYTYPAYEYLNSLDFDEMDIL